MPSLPARLAAREAGACSAVRFAGATAAALRDALSLSGRVRLGRAAPPGVGLLCLELDTAQQRLLLAGAADGSVALFDVESGAGVQSPSPSPPALRLPRGVAHDHGCAAAAWYPSGGGLFFTAGLDGALKGWDASCGVEALTLLRRSVAAPKLYALALPACAAAPHGLAAAGAADGRVLLCDPAAGGAAHCLSGHRAAVYSATWLPGEEHVLATGGADGAIRLWDIRMSGTLALLDQHRSVADVAGVACARPFSREVSNASATAHTGAVTALAAGGAGLLYSHGCDGRVRAWCTRRALHAFLHFPAAATPNAARLGTRIALSADATTLYVPARAAAQPLCARTGAAKPPLAGAHYADVVAVVAHPHTEHVFTAGQDGAIMAWTPRRGEGDVADDGAGGAKCADVDTWSDEDEAERGPRMAYRPRR